MKRFCLFFIGLLVTTALMAQNGVVSGVVSDADSGEPLVGATVIEVGTNNGTVTDVDGKYILKLTKQTAQLRFSYLGYADLTAHAKAGATLNLILKPLAHQLHLQSEERSAYHGYVFKSRAGTERYGCRLTSGSKLGRS